MTLLALGLAHSLSFRVSGAQGVAANITAIILAEIFRAANCLYALFKKPLVICF